MDIQEPAVRLSVSSMQDRLRGNQGITERHSTRGDIATNDAEPVEAAEPHFMDDDVSIIDAVQDESAAEPVVPDDAVQHEPVPEPAVHDESAAEPVRETRFRRILAFLKDYMLF